MLFALLLIVSEAAAAPCCGGSASLPTLITGDDQAQLSFSVSRASVIGDAPAAGLPVFRSSRDAETTETLKLDGAWMLSERWQAGASLPVLWRARETTTSSARSQGLGDVSVSAAYEFLPERTYSVWRPRGFFFLQSTLPTSPSIHDAVAPYLVDARGRGFFSVAGGAAFVKVLGNWDLLLTAELHRAFARTFQDADGSITRFFPGWGGSALLGAGWSPGGGAFRLGLSFAPVFEGAITSEGGVNTTSSSQLVWNSSAQFAYAFDEAWATNVAYTDQTLLGPARNVSLSRTVIFSLQKRWPL
ncbi:MAG: serine protease spb1 [Bacteriovoracia bacterium]